MLAKIAARNRFFPECWKVSKTNSTKLDPEATVQAKSGWDLREFQTFGLPLSPVLMTPMSNTRNSGLFQCA